MRSLVWFVAVVALVGGISASCFAQQPVPATLENLSKDGGNAPSVASGGDATVASQKRPAGTLTRPKNGASHPDLDKAWSQYDDVVVKAADGIRAAISKQFDAAAAKGDLDAAEKWQAALEKFEKSGEIPSGTETKPAVNAAVADYKRAKEELGKAYDALVKLLTMDKKILEAKAARDEWATCSRGPSTTAPDKPAAPPVHAPKQAVVVGRWRRVGNGGIAMCDFRADGTGRLDNHRVVWKQTGPNSFRFDFPDHPEWFMNVVTDKSAVKGILDNGAAVDFLRVE